MNIPLTLAVYPPGSMRSGESSSSHPRISTPLPIGPFSKSALMTSTWSAYAVLAVMAAATKIDFQCCIALLPRYPGRSVCLDSVCMLSDPDYRIPADRPSRFTRLSLPVRHPVPLTRFRVNVEPRADLPRQVSGTGSAACEWNHDATSNSRPARPGYDAARTRHPPPDHRFTPF